MKSGHDGYGPFRVDIASQSHPVTKGLSSFATRDELYFNQQGSEPIEVLATAHSKTTGKDEPIAFVYHYGAARVFQTFLGHDAASLRSPGVAQLVRRAYLVGGRSRSGQSRAGRFAGGRPAAGVPSEAFGKSFDPRLGSVEVKAKPGLSAVAAHCGTLGPNRFERRLQCVDCPKPERVGRALGAVHSGRRRATGRLFAWLRSESRPFGQPDLRWKMALSGHDVRRRAN